MSKFALSIVHCFFLGFFFFFLLLSITFIENKNKTLSYYTNNWKRKEKSQKSHGNSFIKRCKNTEGLRDTYSQKWTLKYELYLHIYIAPSRCKSAKREKTVWQVLPLKDNCNQGARWAVKRSWQRDGQPQKDGLF